MSYHEIRILERQLEDAQARYKVQRRLYEALDQLDRDEPLSYEDLKVLLRELKPLLYEAADRYNKPSQTY
jgi:uncharacterized coiled-coil DUF342 family protein